MEKEQGTAQMRRGYSFGWTVVAIGCLGLLFVVGCSDDSGETSPPISSKSSMTKPAPSAPVPPPGVPEMPAEPAIDTRTPVELVKAGRGAYNANCIACHSVDPTQDGALGPAVAGSSLELLTARILHSEYPEGYTPKRPSRLMVPLPHLEERLPELAAYLNSL